MNLLLCLSFLSVALAETVTSEPATVTTATGTTATVAEKTPSTTTATAPEETTSTSLEPQYPCYSNPGPVFTDEHQQADFAEKFCNQNQNVVLPVQDRYYISVIQSSYFDSINNSTYIYSIKLEDKANQVYGLSKFLKEKYDTTCTALMISTYKNCNNEGAGGEGRLQIDGNSDATAGVIASFWVAALSY